MSVLVEVPNSFVSTSVIAIAISTVISATPRWLFRVRFISGTEIQHLLHQDPRLSGELYFVAVRALHGQRDAHAARQPAALTVGLGRVPRVLPLDVLPVPELDLDVVDVVDEHVVVARLTFGRLVRRPALLAANPIDL